MDALHDAHVREWQDALIVKYQYLPRWVYQRLARTAGWFRLGHEEAESVGLVALVEAGRSFEVARSSFVTYATMIIRQALTRACFENASVIRVPMTIIWQPKIRPKTAQRAKNCQRVKRLKPHNSGAYIAEEDDGSDEIKKLRRCILELPAPLSEIVTRHLAGETFKSIGRSKGFSRQYASHRWEKALEQLRVMMESQRVETGARGDLAGQSEGAAHQDFYPEATS